MISNALVDDTAPKFVQVVPSVEYCQVPLPVTEVIAKPLDGLVSTSAQVEPLRIAEASVPEEVVFSFVVAKVWVYALVIVGASLTLETTICAVAEFVENAVVPPLEAVVA